MSDPGGIRNLDDLREDDDERRMPPGVTLILVALGGACIAFTAFALGGRSSKPQAAKNDPLDDLLAHHTTIASAGSGGMPAAAASTRLMVDLAPRDVTFPGILSDDEKPSTALAAVRGDAFHAGGAAAPIPTQPPPATDRLPVVPLPAQAVLEATPIVTRPRDALTRAATDAANINGASSTDASPAGHDGGYQLQVSSFHTQGEAQAFADQLRARGHKAYVVEAHVPNRGTWFRVRVGPFPTQRAAAQYRAGFEEREHVVPFIVAPDAVTKNRTP